MLHVVSDGLFQQIEYLANLGQSRKLPILLFMTRFDD